MTDLLTTAEFAARCRVPVETARYWRHKNFGPPSFKLGRHVLYARDDVESWIAEQRATEQPNPAA